MIDPREQRRHSRTNHAQPVRVKLMDGNGQIVDEGWARVTDLSPSGLRLQGLRLYRQTEITDQHRFSLCIVFEDGCQFIDTRSTPRWADEDGDFGLEFDDIELRTAGA